MDPWQRIESLSQQLKYMSQNIEGYRQSLKVAKAEKEVAGRKQRPPPLLFLSSPPPFFFFLPLVGPREALAERLEQAHVALDAHLKLCRKYREKISELEGALASRPSHPAKRPLPVGVVQHPEAKTKKLASNELPRPSRAPEP